MISFQVAGAIFIAFVVIGMLLLQYWIIPTYVPKPQRTTATHWTLLAGNVILVLYNLSRMDFGEVAKSGNEIGSSARALGGKRK